MFPKILANGAWLASCQQSSSLQFVCAPSSSTTWSSRELFQPSHALFSEAQRLVGGDLPLRPRFLIPSRSFYLLLPSVRIFIFDWLAAALHRRSRRCKRPRGRIFLQTHVRHSQSVIYSQRLSAMTGECYTCGHSASARPASSFLCGPSRLRTLDCKQALTANCEISSQLERTRHWLLLE